VEKYAAGIPTLHNRERVVHVGAAEALVTAGQVVISSNSRRPQGPGLLAQPFPETLQQLT